MIRTMIGALCSLGLAVAMVTSTPVQAEAKAKTYKNCTALNKVYKHGVGKPGARDKTKSRPVTNFTRSKTVYQLNKKSDRDKDGIACEKK